MTDRLALVTGTSSGIGAAVADRLLHDGWHVLGVSRRRPDRNHTEYEHLELDLADTEGLSAAVEGRVAPLLQARSWGRVGLVNNAALGGPLGPLERVAPADLLKAHAVNVVAPTWLMAFLVRCTPEDTPLRIVNVSSGAAVHAIPGLGPYCSSKAALRMAGMVLGAEIGSSLRNTPAPRDTAILSYEPGVVETAMQQTARGAPAEDFPWVGIFIDFKARGIVVPPEAPARQIVTFLEGAADAVFTERRLGG